MSDSAIPDLGVNTLFSQHGKVVVVTGGGTGLGLMMATAFVQNGAKGEQIESLFDHMIQSSMSSL